MGAHPCTRTASGQEKTSGRSDRWFPIRYPHRSIAAGSDFQKERKIKHLALFLLNLKRIALSKELDKMQWDGLPAF